MHWNDGQFALLLDRIYSGLFLANLLPSVKALIEPSVYVYLIFCHFCRLWPRLPGHWTSFHNTEHMSKSDAGFVMREGHATATFIPKSERNV